MPQLRLIDGAGWGALDGQTLTANNSGPSAATRLTSVTAGVWTLRAATPVELPLGSLASGYAESPINTQAAIQVDPAGTALSGSPPTGNNTDYWLDFWLMGLWDSVTQLPVSQSDFLVLANSGYYVHSRICCNASAGPPALNPPGWGIVSGNSAGTTPKALYLSGNTTGAVTGMWGEWNRLTFHVKYGASGLVEIFQNGTLVSSTTSDTTQITWGGQALQITLPAWSGVKWRIAGPIQSHNGTDLSVRPLYELDNKPSSLVTKLFLPFGVTASGGQTQGVCFVSSGTGTVSTDAEYATSGNTPFRRRMIFSGNGSAPVATTIDEIGELPFNQQGWAHLVLSDVSVPSGTTLQVQFNKAGSSNELIRLFITSGSLFAAYNGGSTVNVAPWTTTLRYMLAVHLHRGGKACFTLCDVTTSPMTGSVHALWSGPLQDWAPQAIGTLKLTATTTASNVETGFLAVCRRPTFSTIDSLTASQYASVSPAIRTSANVARGFPFGQESTTIPGGYYPLKEHGLERRIIIAPLGAGGLTRRQWTQMVGAGMTHTRGVEILVIDGGSINDIATIQTGSAANVVDGMRGNLEQFIEQSVAHDNAVWLATMLPRNRVVTITGATNASPIVLTVPSHGIAGTTTRAYISGVAGNTAANGFYTSVALTDGNTITLTGSTGNGSYAGGGTIQGFTPTELDAISTFNECLRSLVGRLQAKGLLSLSDIEADALANPALYPNTGGANGFWQDFTHPAPGGSPAGAGVTAERMVKTRRAAPNRFPARRWASAQ